MPQISKYPISKNIYDRCWDIFTKTLIGVKNTNDAQQIMNDLLTPTERVMLVKRLSIAFLLLQGYEYRPISRILRVSFPTISMVSSTLKYGNNDGYKKLLSQILKDEKFQMYFNKLIKNILQLPAKSPKGSGVWRYLEKEVKKSTKEKSF